MARKQNTCARTTVSITGGLEWVGGTLKGLASQDLQPPWAPTAICLPWRLASPWAQQLWQRMRAWLAQAFLARMLAARQLSLPFCPCPGCLLALRRAPARATSTPSPPLQTGDNDTRQSQQRPERCSISGWEHEQAEMSRQTRRPPSLAYRVRLLVPGALIVLIVLDDDGEFLLLTVHLDDCAS